MLWSAVLWRGSDTHNCCLLLLFLLSSLLLSMLTLALTHTTNPKHSRHIVAESFHKLFKAVGLPSTFRWDDTFWVKLHEKPEFVSKEDYDKRRQDEQNYRESA